MSLCSVSATGVDAVLLLFIHTFALSLIFFASNPEFLKRSNVPALPNSSVLFLKQNFYPDECEVCKLLVNNELSGFSFLL